MESLITLNHSDLELVYLIPIILFYVNYSINYFFSIHHFLFVTIEKYFSCFLLAIRGNSNSKFNTICLVYYSSILITNSLNLYCYKI